VLLDDVLPGLSGLEVLAKVRQSAGTRDTKVLLLAQATPVLEARRLFGADDAIRKPLELVTLDRKMGRLLA
jgi:CheY-like chemotaxis protein